MTQIKLPPTKPGRFKVSIHVVLGKSETCFLFSSAENGDFRVESEFINTFSDDLLGELLAPQPTENTESNKTGWTDAYNSRYRFRSRWMKQLEQTMHTLEKDLVTPLSEFVQSKNYSSVYIVLDPKLRQFPILSLFNKASRHISWFSFPSIRRAFEILSNPTLNEEEPSFLAIANPKPSMQPSLPDSLDEATLISLRFFQPWGAAVLAPTILSEEQATEFEVQMAIVSEYHSILHIACHATFSANPWKSGFYLSGDRFLTFSHILEKAKHGGGRLAFLAGCETGKASAPMAMEGQDFTSLFHQMGYAAVISTLWPVDSLTTVLFSIYFYTEWLDKNTDIREAFYRTQRWIKSTTSEEKIRFLESEVKNSISSRLHPVETQSKAKASISRLVSDLQGRPGKIDWSHPDYWAAYTFSGV